MPKWMPGAGFLRKAEIWKKKMEDFVDLPYEFVKKAMVNSFHYGQRIHMLTDFIEIWVLQALILFHSP